MFEMFKKKKTLHIEQKASAIGAIISSGLVGSRIYPPRNYETYAKEGYANNFIIYRCLNEIANSLSSVKWYVRDYDNHPALLLLQQPNATQSWSDLVKQMVLYYYISGNNFTEAQIFGERLSNPTELWALRPDRMRVVAGAYGLPSAYEYEKSGKVIFDCDQMTGFSKIHHWKNFNPTDDFYGLSPLQTAAAQADQHNAASIFNASLLQNSAVPSGMLVMKDEVTDAKALEKVKLDFYNKYQGIVNAGKPLIHTGDWSWVPFSASPKDLQIFQGMDKAAEAICIALGVPIELLLPSGTTYANKAEARALFWENSIIPLAKQMQGGLLNGWLAKFYPKNTPDFYYDENDITALMPRRAKYQATVINLYEKGIITRNQALVELNMDKVAGGDIYAGNAPAGAQITAQPNSQEGGALQAISDVVKSKHMELKATDNLNELSSNVAISTSQAAVEAIIAQLVLIFGNDFLQQAESSLALQYSTELQAYVSTHAAELIANVDSTTKNLIKAQIEQAIANNEGSEQLKQRLQKLFTEFKPWRSQMIATTEVTQAMGQASLIAAKQAGINKLEWVSVIDGKTRDTHSFLDGVKIAIGEKFVASDGDSAATVGQFGQAENNINCRCAVIAAFDNIERSYDDRRIIWKQKDDLRSNYEELMRGFYFGVFDKQLADILQEIDNVA